MIVRRQAKQRPPIKPISFRLDPALVERLIARAEREQISLSAIVSRALKEWDDQQPAIRRKSARKAIVAPSTENEGT